MEFWKAIKFNRNYEVSNMGRIRNAKTKHILSTKPTKSHRHPQVFLRINGLRFYKVQYTVSHIVYDHFCKVLVSDLDTTANWSARVKHRDGNILNNNANNLYV